MVMCVHMHMRMFVFMCMFMFMFMFMCMEPRVPWLAAACAPTRRPGSALARGRCPLGLRGAAPLPRVRGCRGAAAAGARASPRSPTPPPPLTPAPEPAGGVSIEVELPQLPPGHQLAWCRAYDVAARRGVLVDLHTKREWRSLLRRRWERAPCWWRHRSLGTLGGDLARADTPLRARWGAAVRPCCPAVALPMSPIPRRPTRRWEVEAADLTAPADGASLFVGEFVEYLPSAAQQAVDATARGGGAERPTGWVRGLMGWPLMCQALSQGVDLGVDPGAEVATSTAGVLR